MALSRKATATYWPPGKVTCVALLRPATVAPKAKCKLLTERVGCRIDGEKGPPSPGIFRRSCEIVSDERVKAKRLSH